MGNDIYPKIDLVVDGMCASCPYQDFQVKSLMHFGTPVSTTITCSHMNACLRALRIKDGPIGGNKTDGQI